jgi:hypothetical protein
LETYSVTLRSSGAEDFEIERGTGYVATAAVVTTTIR